MRVKEFAKTLTRLLPDEVYLHIKYRMRMGKRLNLKNPETFSEKLQWLKLHDRKPIYTQMADKLLAKAFVAERIGEDHVIPTLGVWDRFEEIDLDTLPEQFVLKCTHDSGGLVICRDKAAVDWAAARKRINGALKKNYYWHTREWPYKHIQPRILAEPLLSEGDSQELRDYKFFCFDGQPRALFVATDRQRLGTETKFDFFDMDFGHLDIQNGHPNRDVPPEKPQCFEEMKAFAGVLSAGVPQLRVDFYEVEGHVYFGEMTFYHYGGMMAFQPEAWDKIFGEWIRLPQ